MGYESENCGESQKNYADEKYIANKNLELVLQKNLKKIHFGVLVI